MKKLSILLAAIVILPFAANQAIGFAEKCETYKARVTLENIENAEKIAVLMAHAQALRESNKSTFETAPGDPSKFREIRFPSSSL
jgi:hypothetical protein